MKHCIDCRAETGKGPGAKRCRACSLVVLRSRARERQRRLREADPGLSARLAKERRARDPLAALERQRDWKARAAEHVSEYQRQWRAANQEACREHSRASYARHSEARKASATRWSRSNPERKRTYHLRRMAGYPDVADARSVINCGDGLCAYCLKPDANLAIEHVVPVSRGGSGGHDNLVMACKRCNSSKHTRTPLEFMFGLPRLGVPRCQ